MKILYIHQYFITPDKAGGTRSYWLAKELIAKGHEVIMLTSRNEQKKFIEVEDIDGIHVIYIRSPYSNSMSFPYRLWSFLKFMLTSTWMGGREKGIDLIYATSTPLSVGVPALTIKWFKRINYIFEVRDVWPEVPVAMGIIKSKPVIKLLNRFEEYIYKHAAHIVTLSDDMRNSIITRTNTPSQKLSVIPNIADMGCFSIYKDDQYLLTALMGNRSVKIVLYAGTLGMVNGIKYMLDLAIHSLRIDPSVKYVIFGNGKEKEMLLQYAHEQGVLQQNVFFFDPVPKSQLPQLYHECTVATSFVIPIPELWANSANKFFDCLAAGRPIVINHRGWQATVIEQENIGFVLDADVNKIAQEAMRFCEYLSNTQLLLQQGIRAKQVAGAKYSLEIASGNYLKIVNHVVS